MFSNVPGRYREEGLLGHMKVLFFFFNFEISSNFIFGGVFKVFYIYIILSEKWQFYFFLSKLDFLNVFFFFLFLKFLLLFKRQLYAFFSPSLHPTPAESPSLPHFHPPPWFCPRVLYSSSCAHWRFISHFFSLPSHLSINQSSAV